MPLVPGGQPWSMAVNILHPGVARRDALQRPGAHLIDWQAAQRAERSCCCPAKPVVIVIMPPAPGRAHQTDLLLCGHHYRVSRQALAAAGATAVDITTDPPTNGAWPLGQASV